MSYPPPPDGYGTPGDFGGPGGYGPPAGYGPPPGYGPPGGHPSGYGPPYRPPAPGAATGARVGMFLQGGLFALIGLLLLVFGLRRAALGVSGTTAYRFGALLGGVGFPILVVCLSVTTLILAARLGAGRGAVRIGALVLEWSMVAVNAIIMVIALVVAITKTDDARIGGVVFVIIFLLCGALAAGVIALLTRPATKAYATSL